MNDFKKFVRYVKKSYLNDFKVTINLPSSSSIDSDHQESIMRISNYARMFNIDETDLDSVLFLAHLQMLSSYCLILPLNDIIRNFNDNIETIKSVSFERVGYTFYFNQSKMHKRHTGIEILKDRLSFKHSLSPNQIKYYQMRVEAN